MGNDVLIRGKSTIFKSSEVRQNIKALNALMKRHDI